MILAASRSALARRSVAAVPLSARLAARQPALTRSLHIENRVYDVSAISHEG